MSIILISSNSSTAEAEIAEKIITQQNFSRLNAGILSDIAAAHAVDERKLSDALQKKPSVLRRMPFKRWQYYLSCIEAEVLGRLQADNIVCWGLAAHLYVTDVSHALKIRIIPENTASQQMPAGPGPDDHETQAGKRKKWSLAAYNIDEADASYYDLVINLGQIDIPQAVDTITSTVEYRQFQPITYSTKRLADLALAARVKAELLKSMPNIAIQACDGTVVVATKASKWEKNKRVKNIKELACKIDGVRCVEVHVMRNFLTNAA